MPLLTPADEQFYHQLPEPLLSMATYHQHWRESYFFALHPRTAGGDALFITMAHFPAREEMDSLFLGRVGGELLFNRFARPYAGDPHTTVVGPVHIDVVEPFREIRLEADPSASPLGFDLAFRARTAPYALRRGTMKAGHEVIWDQSHMFQAGVYDGSYTWKGVTHPVEGWWGQRDHSWGIREHRRCPYWMWVAIQFEDGMLGVWHWEYANGARVFSDGCWAPADGSDPVPAVDFRHDLQWIGADGAPISYGRDGEGVAGVAGRVAFTLEGGRTVDVEVSGRWAGPYGPVGGGLNLVWARAADGREGPAIVEITGAHHHRMFPIARAENLPK